MSILLHCRSCGTLSNQAPALACAVADDTGRPTLPCPACGEGEAVILAEDPAEIAASVFAARAAVDAGGG